MAAAPPPKPWERNRGAANTSLATQPAGSTLASAAASTAEGNSLTSQNALASSTVATTTLNRPVPSRPWDRTGIASTSYSQPYGTSTSYGGSTGMYGSYGTSGYMNQYNGMGSTYGSGYGSTYGSGLGSFGGYGRPGYGGYGGYGGSSMYGSPYNSLSGGYGSQMYPGMNGLGGSFGAPGMVDPNNPPAQPPSAWQHFLMAMNGALQFFSKIAFLVDENTHAFHFFINALLQLLDRAGSLYGELARFILRLLRRKRGRPVKEIEPVAAGQPMKQGFDMSQAIVPRNPWNTGAPMSAAPAGPNWDGLWKD